VTPAIRPAGDDEVVIACDLLRRAGFGLQVGRLLEYPRHSPDGAILLAHADARDQRAVGVACCASFGATGWIGALGVTPEARGRGLGTALTEAAVAWLRGRGAETVLLYATEAGRPIYERLGFEAEGRATAYRGVAGAAAPVHLRRLTEADRRALRAVDRATTGEDRTAVLDAVRPLAGVAAPNGSGSLAGWAVASPWGAGASIAAEDPETGIALMAAASIGPAPGTLLVPDANHAAVEALRAWRFARLNDALRMRLGPTISWAPHRQFGLFNLFWG
jgi:GNAT superfamily N-acetyltransferase